MVRFIGMVGQSRRNFTKMASWSRTSEHLVNPIGMSDQLKCNNQVDIIDIITAPEIEMLIIFAENKYTQFMKTGKKPSDFCTQDLRMPNVKKYEFVYEYFSDVTLLITAIKEYHRVKRIPKGENDLLSILK